MNFNIFYGILLKFWSENEKPENVLVSYDMIMSSLFISVRYLFIEIFVLWNIKFKFQINISKESRMKIAESVC